MPSLCWHDIRHISSPFGFISHIAYFSKNMIVVGKQNLGISNNYMIIISNHTIFFDILKINFLYYKLLICFKHHIHCTTISFCKKLMKFKEILKFENQEIHFKKN
jgi:hypothetical protein